MTGGGINIIGGGGITTTGGGAMTGMIGIAVIIGVTIGATTGATTGFTVVNGAFNNVGATVGIVVSAAGGGGATTTGKGASTGLEVIDVTPAGLNGVMLGFVAGAVAGGGVPAPCGFAGAFCTLHTSVLLCRVRRALLPSALPCSDATSAYAADANIAPSRINPKSDLVFISHLHNYGLLELPLQAQAVFSLLERIQRDIGIILDAHPLRMDDPVRSRTPIHAQHGHPHIILAIG
jgi:hypothetical protein